VCVADINARGGAETVALIRKEGGVAQCIAGDITKRPDVERTVAAIVKAYGRLDALVNNAGVASPRGPFEAVTDELWDRLHAINVKGAFLACQYAAPIMKRQRSGSIINISATSAVTPSAGIICYTVSKGALSAMTRGLAIELAPYLVRVNTVTPGPVDTPIWSQYVHDDLSIPELLNNYLSVIPLGRVAVPDDIAPAAVYFASDESSYITGSDLVIAGGIGVGSGYKG
jgi:3-oxoacyl-[acyl-carrier protein] reductase